MTDIVKNELDRNVKELERWLTSPRLAKFKENIKNEEV